ncbi:serine/threonine protein kinase [Nocardia panacis]|uniref:non-specific serine/threonine protein kinase n=1 Tax=Nocardia panacis TaxID=2340916 RepID=A0A3A4KLV7_9NOCA|nr:serine/threonine-protein kinase [Nocardia panacis]RJO75006.1 serine/threonine protein kinase [Nocardia panacis]
MLSIGDTFAGFMIERMLGQGGMGSVYLARHPRLPRQTALKLLNRELFADAEVRARFEREADLVAQLDHPNIVAVYDRGAQDEQLWISMQYVDGVDAASVRPHELPPERAVQIVEGVAAALDYAHGLGVLHRDVKPANIMLARADSGRRERVFLTDFGIARLREDSTHLTQTGMFTATLAYASPEQMTGAALGGASDQYSLACSLFWLLTGTAPFDAANPADIIRGHLQVAPPAVSPRRGGVSPALDAVIAKAMAKRPGDRFGSCGEFAAAAKQALTVGYSAAPTMTAGIPAQSVPQTGYAMQGNAFPVTTGYPPAMQPYSPSQAIPVRGFPPSPIPPAYPPQSYAKPPKRSKTGVIVAICAVVAVLGVAVVAGVVVLSRSDSPKAGSETGGPSDGKSLVRAFPQLLPRDVDTESGFGIGEGYREKECFLHTNLAKDSRPITDSKVPDFSNWVAAWDCFGSPLTEPNMAVVAFKTPAAAKAALASLPANITASESNGGKTMTTHRWKADKSLPEAYVAVGFESDPSRANCLFLAHVTIDDGRRPLSFTKTSVAWKDWFATVPL